jgi:hypothetical protein
MTRSRTPFLEPEHGRRRAPPADHVDDVVDVPEHDRCDDQDMQQSDHTAQPAPTPHVQQQERGRCRVPGEEQVLRQPDVRAAFHEHRERIQDVEDDARVQSWGPGQCGVDVVAAHRTESGRDDAKPAQHRQQSAADHQPHEARTILREHDEQPRHPSDQPDVIVPAFDPRHERRDVEDRIGDARPRPSLVPDREQRHQRETRPPERHRAEDRPPGRGWQDGVRSCLRQ